MRHACTTQKYFEPNSVSKVRKQTNSDCNSALRTHVISCREGFFRSSTHQHKYLVAFGVFLLLINSKKIRCAAEQKTVLVRIPEIFVAQANEIKNQVLFVFHEISRLYDCAFGRSANKFDVAEITFQQIRDVISFDIRSAAQRNFLSCEQTLYFVQPRARAAKNCGLRTKLKRFLLFCCAAKNFGIYTQINCIWSGAKSTVFCSAAQRKKNLNNNQMLSRKLFVFQPFWSMNKS
jgi:hypothetical protein